MANLKELFPEFYQTSLNMSDLSNQTDNLIVLDTNYLLDIIQLPTTVSKKYIEALEKVKDNIYIPYLTALEFNFKKSSIKKEKIKKIKAYKDTVTNSVSAVEKAITTIDLVDKSEKEEFITELVDVTKDYSEKLVNLIEEKIESIITKEEVELYDKLIQIIEEKIGDKYTQEWISSVEEEGKERYEKKIPPGFNDTGKEDENDSIRRYGDIEYQRKYGDLLIWKDIIKYSKNSDKLGKKVIFVTNDGKSDKKVDLLYKVHNLTVGPNIHLMNELQVEASKEFHILNNLRFVQLANNLSDVEMNELKTSSEELYNINNKFNIQYNKIGEVLKQINELNAKNDDFELGIDNDGYGMATVFLTNFIRCRTSFRMLFRLSLTMSLLGCDDLRQELTVKVRLPR
ncbi:hypothetical protein EB09_00705 [Enterococcus faecium]|uniref:PIN-like domain-containing protein n=1 Tax=Enterococcus faecium TaxID=1352 RepID=UPI000DEBF5B0|nr:PIN-like domain-containing protein [Enterococcus faecium]RBS27855.1 hypothetical protein EB09_00705 [Enterococcus faecium]WCG54016.1 PIN-like domain-containing protein [Enterococcus faecium]